MQQPPAEDQGEPMSQNIGTQDAPIRIDDDNDSSYGDEENDNSSETT